MKEWGGPIALYVAVIVITTVGVGAGSDGDKWWVVPLAGLGVPVAGAVAILMMVGLDALWGKK